MRALQGRAGGVADRTAVHPVYDAMVTVFLVLTRDCALRVLVPQHVRGQSRCLIRPAERRPDEALRPAAKGLTATWVGVTSPSDVVNSSSPWSQPILLVRRVRQLSSQITTSNFFFPASPSARSARRRRASTRRSAPMSSARSRVDEGDRGRVVRAVDEGADEGAAGGAGGAGSRSRMRLRRRTSTSCCTRVCRSCTAARWRSWSGCWTGRIGRRRWT